MPIISLNNINFSQKGIAILKGVDFEVNKGEFIYLIGKTGSGKSSLLRIIFGDLPIQEGEGVVSDFDLKTLNHQSIPQLRRKIGIVFQDFKLFNDRSVYENLAFVLRATDWKDKVKIQNRISEVLRLVGLETKGNRMPFELSGGEQQRVAIARAFLNEPELILADEPTGNLDPETSENVIQLLKQLCDSQNITVIIATHNYQMLEKYKGEVWQCQNGRLVR
ncbi:MAG: ATP-binding cassette domain-containing protein [Saprospiraceae bacterium]|nr:ATP-binding cassette domain-containing protein [Saprospiraceae bacterium]